MSSVASTSSAAVVRPPYKRVRYLTDDSSYSSFSATSTIRREAEEQAARELAAERQASRQRVLAVWEGLEERYSRALDDDDIIDLESLTVVQDAGTLKEIANVPFGSLAAQDDVTSDNDEEDDELADWDDERYSAQHTWNRLQTGAGDRPYTEEDEQDLQEFLRAESARRREEELSEEQDDYSYRPYRSDVKNKSTKGEYVTESEVEEDEEKEGEEEEESVSSFRPTPSQDRESRSASSTESGESDDELAGSGPEQIAEPRLTGARASQDEATNSEESASSSEDEIAASDVERERLYQERLRTEEPLGRGRFSSVQVADSPKPPKSVRTMGNPQLSTPPRSKSFSTSSDVFYQGPSPPRRIYAIRPHSPKVVPKPALAQTTARSRSVLPPSKRRSSPPPFPDVMLGKRKRGLSPPPTPRNMFTQGRNAIPRNSTSLTKYIHHGRNYSHARTYSSSAPTEPPVSIDEYDQGEYDSPDEVDTLSRRSLSPIPYPDPFQLSRPQHPSQGRAESLAPSNLSQLVFHLKKVNEWVQTHHVDDLSFPDDPPFPSLADERSPSKRPAWPAPVSNSTSGGAFWSSQFTPPNRNRILSTRGTTSSTRSSRTYSSLMGPPPTPARLFEPGSTPSSTQTTPNKISPVKSSPYNPFSTSSSRISRTVPTRSDSSIRAVSSQVLACLLH